MMIVGGTSQDIRNQQCGDWIIHSSGDITVSSVPLGDWRYELLIQIHELVEAAICKHRGITDEQVTQWDAQFEKEREDGVHLPTDEDGDDPRAPYRREHFAATNIERILAAELDVVWSDYENAIYDR